jgi:hypothetical protein
MASMNLRLNLRLGWRDVLETNDNLCCKYKNNMRRNLK